MDPCRPFCTATNGRGVMQYFCDPNEPVSARQSRELDCDIRLGLIWTGLPGAGYLSDGSRDGIHTTARTFTITPAVGCHKYLKLGLRLSPAFPYGSQPTQGRKPPGRVVSVSALAPHPVM